MSRKAVETKVVSRMLFKRTERKRALRGVENRAHDLDIEWS